MLELCLKTVPGILRTRKEQQQSVYNKCCLCQTDFMCNNGMRIVLSDSVHHFFQ